MNKFGFNICDNDIQSLFYLYYSFMYLFFPCLYSLFPFTVVLFAYMYSAVFYVKSISQMPTFLLLCLVTCLHGTPIEHKLKQIF